MKSSLSTTRRRNEREKKKKQHDGDEAMGSGNECDSAVAFVQRQEARAEGRKKMRQNLFRKVNKAAVTGRREKVTCSKGKEVSVRTREGRN